MQYGVFDATDILVDGAPVIDFGFIEANRVVFRIAVAEVIPARTGPLRHGVGFAFDRLAGGRMAGGDPVGGFGEEAATPRIGNAIGICQCIYDQTAGFSQTGAG